MYSIVWLKYEYYYARFERCAVAILQTWTYIGIFKNIAFCILPVKFCKNKFIDFHENNESVKKKKCLGKIVQHP